VQDAVIVVGTVGEGRAALDVCHRVDARDTGPLTNGGSETTTDTRP
jgi:hypothetical protein